MLRGTVERGSHGRLQLRDSERKSSLRPNGHKSHTPSEEETSSWERTQKLIALLEPIADSNWNLVSMRIGPRLLCRPPPMGSVVLLEPDGTPPFEGAFGRWVPLVRPESEVALRPGLPTDAEVALLHEIDFFIAEADRELLRAEPQSSWESSWSIAIAGTGYFRTGRRTRDGKLGDRKWGKCPICHAPVVKGRFNPRIPHGKLQPDKGSVVDLRGGYLSRLRETHIVEEPKTYVEPIGPDDDP